MGRPKQGGGTYLAACLSFASICPSSFSPLIRACHPSLLLGLLFTSTTLLCLPGSHCSCSAAAALVAAAAATSVVAQLVLLLLSLPWLLLLLLPLWLLPSSLSHCRHCHHCPGCCCCCHHRGCRLRRSAAAAAVVTLAAAAAVAVAAAIVAVLRTLVCSLFVVSVQS